MRRPSSRLGIAAAFGLGLVGLGCGGGGSSPMGGERQPCYPNGTCNTGLTCLSEICVMGGGTAGTGGGGTGGSSGAAGSGGVTGTGGSATGTGGGGATGTGGGGATGTGGGGGSVGPPPALGSQIDRMGRPEINTLMPALYMGPTARGSRQDMYSAATPGTVTSNSTFKTDFEISLAVYDGLDTVCGNQYLANTAQTTAARYGSLADLLLDDQLYVDTSLGACASYLAVEAGTAGAGATDCGGRTLTADVVDTTYSLLLTGMSGSGVTDGLAQDDKTQSNTVFPFLAAPN